MCGSSYLRVTLKHLPKLRDRNGDPAPSPSLQYPGPFGNLSRETPFTCYLDRSADSSRKQHTLIRPTHVSFPGSVASRTWVEGVLPDDDVLEQKNGTRKDGEVCPSPRSRTDPDFSVVPSVTPSWTEVKKDLGKTPVGKETKVRIFLRLDDPLDNRIPGSEVSDERDTHLLSLVELSWVRFT